MRGTGVRHGGTTRAIQSSWSARRAEPASASDSCRTMTVAASESAVKVSKGRHVSMARTLSAAPRLGRPSSKRCAVSMRRMTLWRLWSTKGRQRSAAEGTTSA